MNPDVTGLSFELYGSDNPHMIQYKDVQLDIVLLFGLRGTHGQIVLNTEIEAGDIPKAEQLGTIETDYVWHYEQEQQDLDKRLSFIGLDQNQAPVFSGEEGSIWYVKLKDTCEIRPYKCKPHRIEQVHWTQGQTQLSPHCDLGYYLKAFENWENPELDEIIAILNEDYPIHQITISMGRLSRCLTSLKMRQIPERKSGNS